MRPAAFQLTFKDLAQGSSAQVEENVALELLPCQFQSNIDSCNKDVYFDPLIKPHTLPDGTLLKETSLQGRKLVGRDLEIPQGYKGVVLAKMHQQTGYIQYEEGGIERIDMEALGTFNRVTEWKKDAWTKERGYASNMLDYLECGRILHCDD